MAKYKITPEDSQLFRDAVKKLRISPPTKKPAKTAVETELYDPSYQKVSPTDSLFYSRGGLQDKVLRDLRAGKIKIQAELDLHGITTEESRQILINFINSALNKNFKTIRIIHGKGNILKNHVNSWLPQINAVLAFSSANPKQGGTGAVVVVLKSPRLHS